MREILFRGKQKDNGEWAEGSSIVYDLHNRYTTIYVEDEGRVFQVDPETFGQYTGLTDRNGERIFEGDILIKRRNAMTKYSNITDHLFAVEWGSDCGMWVLTDIDPESDREIDFESFDACEFEVIGNIHDNLELMKGENHD